MKRFLLLFVMAVAAVPASAQFTELRTVEIGLLSTTHIIFTSDLSYVDVSKPDVIAAKVVDASKNMLAMKARSEFDYITTISALEKNGTMHTFKVVFNPFPSELVVDTRQSAEQSSDASYNTQIRPALPDAASSDGVAEVKPVKPARNAGAAGHTVPAVPSEPNAVLVTSDQSSNFGKADAPTLEEVIGMPQQLYHIADKCYKMEAYVTNVYVYSDLLYVVIQIKNGSDIGYESGNAQFAVENLVQRRQDPSSSKDISSRSSYGTLSCPPKGASKICYTIPKFTLLKNECFKIYIYERKGTRNLFLTLTDKDINYAVSPR